MPRGGYRENAGRKLAVGDKLADEALSMDFTPEGHRVLKTLTDASSLSRNQVLAHLAKYAPRLTFDVDGVAYPGKAGGDDPNKVMRIRLPQTRLNRIKAAQRRTQKSYSDIGEALVRTFGPKETQWPILPGADRRPKRRRRNV